MNLLLWRELLTAPSSSFLLFLSSFLFLLLLPLSTFFLHPHQLLCLHHVAQAAIAVLGEVLAVQHGGVVPEHANINTVSTVIRYFTQPLQKHAAVALFCVACPLLLCTPVFQWWITIEFNCQLKTWFLVKTFFSLVSKWETLNWSCDVRSIERPQNKLHWEGTTLHTGTLRPREPSPWKCIEQIYGQESPGWISLYKLGIFFFF